MFGTDFSDPDQIYGSARLPPVPPSVPPHATLKETKKASLHPTVGAPGPFVGAAEHYTLANPNVGWRSVPAGVPRSVYNGVPFPNLFRSGSTNTS
ncbi:hypothetical protein BQ8482_380220 [Mesorhizobium delmotii]|uniref:Uncharacterized protein n=1 Tax=Mesorhizobium delmotii TaxID=1631247 RepID=A0A2P9ASG3_9HYPH|nr:hypothetical protein BQ8482_380220 [Mesorhizobium delmotii]